VKELKSYFSLVALRKKQISLIHALVREQK